VEWARRETAASVAQFQGDPGDLAPARTANSIRLRVCRGVFTLDEEERFALSELLQMIDDVSPHGSTTSADGGVPSDSGP